METINILKAKLAAERVNRANAAMGTAQIVDDDPRIELITQYNNSMAALTEAERDALLEAMGILTTVPPHAAPAGGLIPGKEAA